MREAWLLSRGIGRERWNYLIQKGSQKIGRSLDCEVHIPHHSVSRRHAEIWNRGGTLYIRDLNSLNGTFVDDIRISESVVMVGMEVRIGRVRLDIVSDPSADNSSSNIDLDAETTSGSPTMVASHTLANIRAPLTVSQRQVLKRLLQGLSEKEVAASLSISRQTVHTHVKDIYRLMNVHSRPELMALFISKTVEMPPGWDDPSAD